MNSDETPFNCLEQLVTEFFDDPALCFPSVLDTFNMYEGWGYCKEEYMYAYVVMSGNKDIVEFSSLYFCSKVCSISRAIVSCRPCAEYKGPTGLYVCIHELIYH